MENLAPRGHKPEANLRQLSALMNLKGSPYALAAYRDLMQRALYLSNPLEREIAIAVARQALFQATRRRLRLDQVRRVDLALHLPTVSYSGVV